MDRVVSVSFFKESAAEGASSHEDKGGEIDLSDLLAHQELLPISIGADTIESVELLRGTYYMNVSQTPPLANMSDRLLAGGVCNSSFSTECSAITLLKYKTQSCAGVTHDSGCSGWAHSTNRGYKWDEDSTILLTSHCSSDVQGAYRTLQMKKYANGRYEQAYTVSQSGFPRFRFILSVTCDTQHASAGSATHAAVSPSLPVTSVAY